MVTIPPSFKYKVLPCTVAMDGFDEVYVHVPVLTEVGGMIVY